MGQIEKTLAKLRQQARQASAEAAQRKSGSAQLAPQSAVDVVQRSDLLERARSITLDPQALERNRITGAGMFQAGAPAYKMLRTRVLHRMRANGWKKLAITSPRANAGKTLTAINTAISLAQEPNQPVVLVDLDLRNPSVCASLGLEAQYGLSDYLLRDLPIEKLLVKPSIPRFYIAPNWEPMENSSEVLASARMAELAQTLAATSASTIVIFDLPPLLDADDMLTFMSQVDAVLFVVAQGETRRADLEKSSELLKELTVLGTVLNKSNDDTPAYY